MSPDAWSPGPLSRRRLLADVLEAAAGDTAGRVACVGLAGRWRPGHDRRTAAGVEPISGRRWRQLAQGTAHAREACYDTIVMERRACLRDPIPALGLAEARLRASGKLCLLQLGEASQPGPDCRDLAQWCGLVPERTLSLPRWSASLAVFGKAAGRRWRVGDIGGAGIGQLQRLFQEAFEGDISEALWHWKYGEGRGRHTIVWRGQTPVAHYGGITRRLAYRGHSELGTFISDVMVKPSERGVFTRKGPFFLSAASFAEAYAGYGRLHLVGTGFPSARHMELAEKLGLYAEVGRMVEVRWPVQGPGREGCTGASQSLSELGTWRRRRVVNRLWRAMRSDLREGILAVRDWSEVAHRFLSHPEIRYEVRAVRGQRGGDRYRGIVVLRWHERACELVDLIAPRRNIPPLVAHVSSLAAAAGRDVVYCWITAAYSKAFEDAGGQVRSLDIVNPTSIWSHGPSSDELQGHWWLMGGDTDFR